MVNFFLRIYDFLQVRKHIYYGLLLAIVVILIGMVSTLRYNEDIYDFLPMDESQQKAVSLYQDITGGQRIVAMISMKDGETNNIDRLSVAVDTFTSKLKSNDGLRHIKNIISQVDYEKIAGIADFAYANVPFMLQDSDYVRMEQILTSSEQVHQSLEQDVQQIMMPATGAFVTNVGNDPLELFSPVMKRMRQRQASLPFETENGYVFSSDKKYAIVLLTSQYGSMESANNTLLVNYVDSVSQQTMQVLPDVDVSITGSPVIAVDNANQIKADSRLAIVISVVLILALLLFSFRSVKHLLLIGVSILFGWLFAMGFVAVLSTNVSLIVLGIGSIIIGIAVNYPLHFIAHVSHGGNIREVLKDMVSPLLIGNITTVGAFASLIPLDAPALRDLGLFAAFMLIGTILFVLIFLPHLVKAEAHKGKERLLFGKLSSFSPKAHGWAFALIVVLTIIFGYYSLGTSFDSNMHHINYLTPTQERLMADLHISAGVKDSANVYVVSEGNSWDEALSEHAKLLFRLDSLKERKEISSYSNVTSFICSQEMQKKRLKKWDDFWNVHRKEVLTMLHKQAPQFGFSEDAFEGFEAIISQSYTIHPFDYYEPLTTVLFNHSFSQSTGRYAVVDIVNVGDGNVENVEKIVNGAYKEQGFSFDFAGMNSAVANALSDNFNYIGFACSFIVFIFLWLSFRRLELSLLAFLPMAISWLWILGIMNLLNMQFNIVNIILATFIFGQGDDYTIFMTDGLINEYTYRKKLLPSYKNSILISALIMFIGMGSLIVAKHPALHSLAEVTIVGMLSVVVMAWIIPPMIFSWMTKTGGHTRNFPVTLGKLWRTIYCAIAYFLEILLGCMLGLAIRVLPVKRDKAQQWLHRVIYRIMRINLRYVGGVKISIHNPHKELFEHGGIIISNHQSILDPILMLALHPNVLILISDKVWTNPIVHALFRLIGFIRLNQDMSNLKEEMGVSISKGYNLVIFPEGKRNDGFITRFHKGAFHIAQELKADVLPIYIHGVSLVMPKDSGFAMSGNIDLVIGQRVSADRLDTYGSSPQDLTHHFGLAHKEKYATLRQELTTTHYYHDYVINKYIYKGFALERETIQLLNHYNDFSTWIDDYKKGCEKEVVIVTNAGHGQFSLLFALVHPEIEVHSLVSCSDDFDIAIACSPLPSNLHIHDSRKENLPTDTCRVFDLHTIF
ncbi:MAG: 1-acyl-sn-glycerol-3-phosphate acyltransferase [Prevotella sp.]